MKTDLKTPDDLDEGAIEELLDLTEDSATPFFDLKEPEGLEDLISEFQESARQENRFSHDKKYAYLFGGIKPSTLESSPEKDQATEYIRESWRCATIARELFAAAGASASYAKMGVYFTLSYKEIKAGLEALHVTAQNPELIKELIDLFDSSIAEVRRISAELIGNEATETQILEGLADIDNELALADSYVTEALECIKAKYDFENPVEDEEEIKVMNKVITMLNQVNVVCEILALVLKDQPEGLTRFYGLEVAAAAAIPAEDEVEEAEDESEDEEDDDDDGDDPDQDEETDTGSQPVDDSDDPDSPTGTFSVGVPGN